MGETGPTQRNNAATVAALAGILCIAAGLRLYNLNADSFTADEISTYQGAIKSLPACLTHRLYPLYYVCAHFALALGDSESLLRMPSVIAGMLGVLAIFGAVCFSHGRAAGLIAALLLAISAYHVAYSREARFYAAAMLFAVLLTWTLYFALEKGGLWRWALFALVGNLALVTHLTVVPFWAALVAGAIVAVPFSLDQPKLWRISLRYAALLTSFSALSLPLLAATYVAKGGGGIPTSLLDFRVPMGAAQAAVIQPASPDQPLAYVLTPLEYLGFLREFFTFAPYGHAPSLMLEVGAALLALLGLLFFWRTQRPLALLIAAGIVLAPVPCFFIKSGHWWEPKYFVSAWPLIIWLIAAGIWTSAVWIGRKGGPRPLRAALATVTVVALLALPISVMAPGLRGLFGPLWTQSRTDWKGLTQFMARTIQSDDQVYYLAGWGEPAAAIDRSLRFYMRRSLENADVVMFDTRPFIGQPKAEDLKLAFRKYPNAAFWFLTQAPPSIPAETMAVINRLQPEEHAFGGTRLWAIGKPTTNLFPLAGFDAEGLAGVLAPPLYLANRAEAFEGPHCLRFENRTGKTSQIGLPVQMTVAAASAAPPPNGVAPQQTYTLSMYLKFWDLPLYTKMGRISLSGVDAGGQGVSVPLIEFGDAEDWHRVVFRIDPKRLLPAETRDIRLEILMPSVGTLWVDSVQLEAGDSPTLFTAGTRPPHDAMLVD